MADAERIWTDEQVAALNERQKRSDQHPYTCPGDYIDCENRRNLIATPHGWVCSCGRYQQWWAHATREEQDNG